MAQPLCCFYATAFARLLELFQLDAAANVVACRGTGSEGCVVSLALSSDRASRGKAERAV